MDRSLALPRAMDRALALPLPEPSPEPPGPAPEQNQDQQDQEQAAPFGTEQLRHEPPARLCPAPARQQPQLGLEAQHEADEPDPAPAGAVPATPHRTQLSPGAEAAPALPRALLRPEPRGVAVAVAVAVAWDGQGLDQSTLELPGTPGRESPAPHPAPPEEEDEEEDEEEEEYPHNEPKQAEGLGAAPPGAGRRGVQRLGWISRPATRSPSPAFQELQPAPDAAFRREAAPAFRKSLLAQSKENRRAEPGFTELGTATSATSEWALPKLDVVGKQSWTVNAEDSVERLLPAPLAVELELRPYTCDVLLEEPAKARGPEPEPEQDDNAGVFTCIECSIYFRRREHLLEHMLQHSRGCAPRADAARCRFCCAECGWAFGDAAALEQHRRQHQESRQKILEEIQKLNEFPDEGRDARLQCPKCVFGTNSSKIFVQHAKMHVKERKEQGSRSSGLFGELRDGAGHGLCKALRAEELPGGKAPSACVLCGFPAPNELVLKEHLRFAHSHFSWQPPDPFQDDPNQPGTSRDSYSPARPAAEFFGKTERLFPPPCRESPSLYDPSFGLGHPRLDKSNGATKKELQGLQHARKAAPCSQPNPAFAGFSSPKSYSSHSALQQLRKRAAPQQLEGDGDTLGGHPEEPRRPWPHEEDEELGHAGAGTVTVPRAALELKRTFRATLRATEAASEEQQRQLRMMVPVVVLPEVATHPRVAKRPRGKPPKKKKKPPAPEEPLPLDVLLLESPLEGPLELEELLGSEATMLRNEERKCPYCPDRFHNGIGLANHVRGHLNRVGVSYNVRHFISAEEVKAIEQKFSFQKKKKKVANFDPGTFSLMRCEFCGAGFDTRAGLSSHARAHLRDFGITNWELTVSPIHILKELLASSSQHPALLRALGPGPGDTQHRDQHQDHRDQPWDHRDQRQDHRDQPWDQHQDPHWDHQDQRQDHHRDQPWDQHQDHRDQPWDQRQDPHRDQPWDHRDQRQDHRDQPWDQRQDHHRDQPWDQRQDHHRDQPWDPHQDPHRDQPWDQPWDHQDQQDQPWDPHRDQLWDHRDAQDPHRDHQWDPHRDHQWDPHRDQPQDHPWDQPRDPDWDPPQEQLQDPPRDPPRDPQRDPRTLASPFPPGWAGDELLQPYRDVLAPDDDDLVAMEVSSPPPLPKKSSALEPPPPRLGSKLSPEPPGSKAEPPDPKAPSLTTCEVCGACFETRKGLSSHARSHLRQLGVAESESSGAPIDLLYELVRHKTKPEAALAKKSASPKEPGAPRALLLLPKAEGALNKAIKSPPGFSKCLAPPGSPGAIKKVPAALPASPKGAEEKGGAKLGALSPLQTEPGWAGEEDGPLNLTSGSEPCRDIRCEFCGEFFENRKGLSSHARSHLRQMGVTEWYVNGSPIDTLREILTRRRSGHPKALPKSLLGSLAPLEPRPPPELHLPGLAKKVPAPLSPPGAASPPPPTARKVFPGLQAPSLQKKLKQDQLRVEIKRELMAGGGGAGIHPGEAPAPPDPAWAAHEEMAPLNLSSRADPVRDIRCEFCGEFFENRKGLSSHARSHLRQMGVTEWSVNGSPIDTLREILRKKSKPCLIKKEPPVPPGLEPGPGEDEGLEAKGAAGLQAPGKALPPGLALAPLGAAARPGKAGAALALAPLGAKNAGAFLAPKRPLAEERLGGHGEAKHKAFELGFKAKALHDKASAEACCELCGLYFENRKALASHARAHLRQFGVTEWCVNGSPIETLREWIRHRPHKAGAYRSYIQGGRPFSKKFRNSSHPREPRGALALPPGPFLPKGGLGSEAALGDCGRGPDGAERGLGTPLGMVKVEESRGNFSKFERRQARSLEPSLSLSLSPGGAGPGEFPRKLQEPRPSPRPVPALVPRPPQTSLVKFVGNIYTLKCRFCEVEFQGPLSIQEEWVRHLQRHILDMNFSKADPCRSEAPPEPPALAEAP